MKINDALNLDIPLYDDNDTIYAHVYSQPISTAAFEANYLLLVRTFETMMSEGRSALRMANLFLKDAAKEIARSRNAKDDGIISVYIPLVNEITRLSMAVVATPQGWDTIPLQQAIDHGKITPDDGREALSAAIFFTAASHVPPRQSRVMLIDLALPLWGASTSSLPLMEWTASLPTSTVTGTTGGTEQSAPQPAPQAMTQPLSPPPGTNSVSLLVS